MSHIITTMNGKMQEAESVIKVQGDPLSSVLFCDRKETEFFQEKLQILLTAIERVYSFVKSLL